jgi:hypothetical protein
VENNPVGQIDPTGEFAWIAAGGVIGAAVNVGTTYFATGGNASVDTQNRPMVDG